MLLTIPWAPWLQLRFGWWGIEILYKPYGVVLYGLMWNRTFKITWDLNVLFDSCGHRTYWCGCWSKFPLRSPGLKV